MFVWAHEDLPTIFTHRPIHNIFLQLAPGLKMHAWARKMNKLSLADELESAHSILEALVQPEEQLPNEMPAWAYMNTLYRADALELARQ